MFCEELLFGAKYASYGMKNKRCALCSLLKGIPQRKRRVRIPTLLVAMLALLLSAIGECDQI